MKKLVTTLLTAFILFTPAVATAEQSPQADVPALFNLKVEPIETGNVLLATEKPAEPPKPQHTVYTVVDGDNLTRIGTKYNVEWQRLWAKNRQLKNPDIIQVGDKITVPFPDEKLKRAVPTSVSLPASTPNVKPLGNYAGGNSYDYGYCTWYVKNRRGSSLPDNLGNANTWYAIAKSMGMAVGTTPKAGAAGTSTAGALGHVVYVESVNKNGTVNISEMNYEAWGVVSRRTVSASEFLYIY